MPTLNFNQSWSWSAEHSLGRRIFLETKPSDARRSDSRKGDRLKIFDGILLIEDCGLPDALGGSSISNPQSSIFNPRSGSL